MNAISAIPTLAVLALVAVGRGATWHVAQTAPGAADTNPGSPERPLATIGAAMKAAQPGDTILVGDGVYREEIVWPEDWNDPARRMTLAAAPDAHPVIDGADPVPGPWERVSVELAAAPPAPAAIYACDWEPYATMVFVDGERLEQIGLWGSPVRAAATNGFQYQKQWNGRTVADLRPGSFFYDGEAKRLYVWLADGGDPAAHTVEASVRDEGFTLRGTWTVRGLEVRRVMDGFWPHEQAAAVTGNHVVVENCRFLHNEFLGLIVSGQDGVVRNNEFAFNGLEGFTSNYGYRMLVEGNEFHHNAWRGDVVCLTFGNKWVMWREGRFLRNWFHDEPAAALWCDINVNHTLIAENRFEDCAVGVYFEISRWGVIANNVFRRCGRAIWVYSSDVLVAHNVIDGCGEGITITGFPRTATLRQTVVERGTPDCLMAVRNNLAVNNLLIDCPGAYIGITEPSAFGWNNYSDYNAFAWTLPYHHATGLHLNFLAGWDSLYGRLPIWRMARHCDTHSMVADAALLRHVREGSRWVGIPERDLVDDAGIVDRAAGDYQLRADSPLRGRGVTLPLQLAAPYQAGEGDAVVSRAWQPTLAGDAPGGETPVYSGAGGHYRLQPSPPTRPLVTLDDLPPGTPGLNPEWAETGRYPEFVVGEETVPDPLSWRVSPDNLVLDPSFDRPFGSPEDNPHGLPWVTRGLHTYAGMACANLGPQPGAGGRAWQRIGVVRPGLRVVVHAEMTVSSRDEKLTAVGGFHLATGPDLAPLGDGIVVKPPPGKTRDWQGYAFELSPETPGVTERIGQDLYVVLVAAVEGAGPGAVDPAVFVRWDNVLALAGPETP